MISVCLCLFILLHTCSHTGTAEIHCCACACALVSVLYHDLVLFSSLGLVNRHKHFISAWMEILVPFFAMSSDRIQISLQTVLVVLLCSEINTTCFTSVSLLGFVCGSNLSYIYIYLYMRVCVCDIYSTIPTVDVFFNAILDLNKVYPKNS